MIVATWLKGLLTLIGIGILAIFGFLFLALFGFAIDLIYLIIFAVFLIIAMVYIPYYIGKQKKVKSQKFSIKKVKKA